jgi:ferrous iron transport protein A
MIFRFASRNLSSKAKNETKTRPPARAPKHAGQRRSASGFPESTAAGPAEVSGSQAGANDSSREIQLLPLSDLPQGVHAIIHEIHLADSAADQVMLFGFMSGVEIVSGQCGPGGDPRVYRLDGTEVAIRRATARHILVRIPFAPEPA